MSRILRYRELRDHGVPWSRAHVDKLEKLGRFPQRVKLSERVVGWLDFEIAALVDGLIGARGDPNTATAAVKAPTER